MPAVGKCCELKAVWPVNHRGFFLRFWQVTEPREEGNNWNSPTMQLSESLGLFANITYSLLFQFLIPVHSAHRLMHKQRWTGSICTQTTPDYLLLFCRKKAWRTQADWVCVRIYSAGALRLMIHKLTHHQKLKNDIYCLLKVTLTPSERQTAATRSVLPLCLFISWLPSSVSPVTRCAQRKGRRITIQWHICVFIDIRASCCRVGCSFAEALLYMKPRMC